MPGLYHVENNGSLVISGVDPRILGCEQAYARSHPHIRLSITAIPVTVQWTKEGR